MTSATGPMASMLRTVSSSVSPLETEEPAVVQLSTSAPSACAAISKEVRVRVESSKKRLATTLPRSTCEASGPPCRWASARSSSASMSARRQPFDSQAGVASCQLLPQPAQCGN